MTSPRSPRSGSSDDGQLARLSYEPFTRRFAMKSRRWRMPPRWRHYLVETGSGAPTLYQTPGGAPSVGDVIATPLGRLRVLEVVRAPRIGRPGEVRAELSV